MKDRILLVEDDSSLTSLLMDELEVEGYQVDAAATVAEAKELLPKHAYSLIVTDLRLPDGSGKDVIAFSKENAFTAGCLVVTAFGSVRDAVDALKQGADDFLTKPLDLEHFLLSVKRLVENEKLRKDLNRLKDVLGVADQFGMVGSCAQIEQLREQVRIVAKADASVLVLGESGTGKELVAKALHQLSARSNGPFIAINCAGIPAELIETELFGHEEGAFTGAKKRHRGIFEQASGGTLFLDEIGEMPLALQVKLLRVLQESSVRPVGATRERSIDVRIIAATHRNIEALVADGFFRDDLYYRLETFKLVVPPLREREHDIELLAWHFLRLHTTSLNRHIAGFENEALDVLRRYSFPGNIRELSNIIERSATFCRSDMISVSDFPDRVLRSLKMKKKDIITSEDDALTQSASHMFDELPTLDDLQKRYAQYVLERTNGNKQRAAAILGVTRSTLYRWLA